MEEMKKYYLSEFLFHDGTHKITMNIVQIDTERKTIAVAITDEGHISVQSFDLKVGTNGHFYFEYGRMLDRIAVNDFEQVKEEN